MLGQGLRTRSSAKHRGRFLFHASSTHRTHRPLGFPVGDAPEMLQLPETDKSSVNFPFCQCHHLPDMNLRTSSCIPSYAKQLL